MQQDRADGELERQLAGWASAVEVRCTQKIPAAVAGELKKSLEKVRPLPSNGELAGQFVLVFGVCAAVLIAVLDKVGLHLMSTGQTAAMAALFGCGGVYFSAWLARRMVPGSRVFTPVAGAALLAGVGAAMALLFPWRLPPEFVAEGWPCALLESIIAVPAAAIFWWMARRGVLVASAELGAGLTALAVFLALTVDQAQCMFPLASHLLLWHGGTAAALVAAGALTGRAIGRRI